MKVFKLCFSIIRARLPELLIYVVIFLFFAIILSNLNQESPIVTFSTTKTNVAVFNNDPDSAVANGLKDYLAKNTVTVSLKNNKTALQDALFFREADSILTIPAGFSEKMKNGTAKIDRSARAGTTGSVQVDNLVDRYLNLVNLYAKSMPQLSESEIVSRVDQVLSKETAVSVHTFGQKDSTSGITYYFNYLAYVALAVLVLASNAILTTFRNVDLRRRNLCAPLRPLSMNLQLLGANLVAALSFWAAASLLGFILYGGGLSAFSLFLYAVNALAVMLTALSIGFLCSSLVKNDQSASAAATVVSLGMSFLCGVFVPLEYMDPSMVKAAHFLPVYWYVRADQLIGALPDFSFSHLSPVCIAFGIEFLFAAAICSIGLILYRQKQLADD